MINKKLHCTAIVLAGGSGTRMQTKTDKQYLSLEGHPVLYYSLKCFEEYEKVQDIVLVCKEKDIPFCKDEIVERYGFQKVKYFAAAGAERYDSVYSGLRACDETDLVFIHDSARPFIEKAILDRALEAAALYGACAVGMPSKDTVKIVNKEGIVVSTPPREEVWLVQTPQVFSYPLICQAHEKLREQDAMKGITDDAMVVEKTGMGKVAMVSGSYENIKLTTPDDLATAKRILETIRERNACRCRKENT